MSPTAETIREALQRTAPRTVPEWRDLRLAWSRQLRAHTAQQVLRIALGLVDHGTWPRLTAYELLACHPGGIGVLTPTAIRRLGRGLDDWGSVDTFACYIAGPAWRDGQLPTRQLLTWLRSKDRWQRRTAVVCTVALNVRARGGRGEVARTLAICRHVVRDSDDMVVKALSWALRSAVEWDRQAVSGFLREHQDVLAGRVKREVASKLRTGRKN